MSYSYSLPRPTPGSDLLALLKHPYVCPWCERTSVPFRKSRRLFAEDDWIATPVRCSGTNWVCEPCVLHLYFACLSLDMPDHLDADLVEMVAEQEGVSPRDIQARVLAHQSERIQTEDPDERDRNYDWLRQRIRDIEAGMAS